ncbi:MAG: D-lyxose/D-mannose family sugar isomerase [bacterium]
MKRSEINAIIRNTMSFLEERNFMLPPFAFRTPEDWAAAGPEADEIRNNQLGWDVTDFGRGDFKKFGITIFTLRNGNHNDPDDKKLYAEKILIVEEGQMTPMHFHRMKMEDIINRGGGNLMMEVYNSTPDDKPADSDVTVSLDGVKRTLPAGAVLRLAPGESVTVTPLLYHKFWVEGGKVLIGEVSSVNDDYTDNVFLDPIGRFPEIEEDEPPLRLLMTEYPKAK